MNRNGWIGLGVVIAMFSTVVVAADLGLEDLKALEGDWARVGQGGAAAEEVTSSWRVTAAGTAIVETLFPGSDHEMVTVYHRDDDRLMLTHYCAGGNQPRMREVAASGPSRLEFDCAGGTGMVSEDDAHMHHLSIEWLDADHIRTTWTSHANGAVDHVAKFDLVRMR